MSYSTLRKILYIESGIDEKAGGKKLEQICAPMPDTVAFTVVTNAFIALECSEHTCYDAIIADEELAELQAIDLLEILYKVGATTPFILLTDRDNPVTRRENKNYVQQEDAEGNQDSYVMDGRFFSSLAKPYSASELCRTLQEVFDYDATDNASDTETDTGSSGENIRYMDEIRDRAGSRRGRSSSGELDEVDSLTDKVPLQTKSRSGSQSALSTKENGLQSRGHSNTGSASSHHQTVPKVQQPRAVVPEKQPVVVHRPKAKRGEKPLINQLFMQPSSEIPTSSASRGTYFNQQGGLEPGGGLQLQDPGQIGLRGVLQQQSRQNSEDRSVVSDNSSPRYSNHPETVVPDADTADFTFRSGNKQGDAYKQLAKAVISGGAGSSRNVSRSNSIDSDHSASKILSTLRIAAVRDSNGSNGLHRTMSGNNLYGNEIRAANTALGFCLTEQLPQSQHPLPAFPQQDVNFVSSGSGSSFDLLNRATMVRSYSADQAEQRPFGSGDNFKPPAVQRTDSSSSNTSTESGATKTSNKRRN